MDLSRAEKNHKNLIRLSLLIERGKGVVRGYGGVVENQRLAKLATPLKVHKTERFVIGEPHYSSAYLCEEHYGI